MLNQRLFVASRTIKYPHSAAAHHSTAARRCIGCASGLAQGMDDIAGGGKTIQAEVPLSEMFGYATHLRSMTQGRATYSMEFKRYAEAPAQVVAGIAASPSARKRSPH